MLLLRFGKRSPAWLLDRGMHPLYSLVALVSRPGNTRRNDHLLLIIDLLIAVVRTVLLALVAYLA